MKSLGSREEQIRSSLIGLYGYCPNSEIYYINILEPTKECLYSFNGEVVRLWYESIGQDHFPISRESQVIIESDTGFFLWKSLGKFYYEFEMENGISDMTNQQFSLSRSYKDYLENGITKFTLMSIINHESNSRFGCE